MKFENFRLDDFLNKHFKKHTESADTMNVGNFREECNEMLRGFYTAASGMFAQQRKTEMLTNNLANVQTPGYKADQATIRSFPEMLIREFNNNNSSSKEVGPLHTGVYVQETIPNFIQGDLQETNRHTDLALMDFGNNTSFFTVRQDEDIRYSRNGSLQISPDGLLTTSEGYPLLSTTGETISVTSDQFTVHQDGSVEENGRIIAQLGIAGTDTPEQLIKLGSGLYQADEPLQNNPVASIHQGFIEASNVDTTRTMTDMLSAYRSFEANQKVVQAYDRSMEKAVNEVGKLNG